MKLNTAERAAAVLSAVLLALMALRCRGVCGARKALGQSAAAALPAQTEPAAARGAPSEERAEETAPAASSPALPVDLNAATLEELSALPGIGPARARAILDWRDGNGPFRCIEDLVQVPGIGEGVFAELEGYVTVGGG